ncbi:hypothetical protein LCGC14_1955210, partial [marine sediment metagenome]
MNNLPTHHICVEVEHEGWTWLCISGTWYEECHILNQFIKMP